MKLNAHVKSQHKPVVMIHVTEDNYSDIREYIDNQVDHFLINSENWILALFKKLPRTSSPEAVSEMEELINTYLSSRDIREMNARFSRDLKTHEPATQVTKQGPL